MAERGSQHDDLAALLQRLRLDAARGGSPPEIAQSQVELLLARIGALTDALRHAPPGDPAGAASRLLLADLAMVAAQLRGHVTAHGERLAHALDGAQRILATGTETRPSGS